MPNIIIKEYDKTSAGIGLYTNFSVLVPGFVNPDKASIFEDASDENGVLEVSTKKDFLEKIGKVAPGHAILAHAIAPTVTGDVIHFEGEEIPAEQEGADPTVLTPKDQLIAFVNNPEALAADENLYLATPNTTDPIGQLKDANYKYTIIQKIPASDEEYWGPITVSSDQSYFKIADANIGADESTATHYGNQIAYELIGLGYTVLFKQLDTVSDLDDADDSFWSPLKDRSIYDFRYVINGLLTGNSTANAAIIKLAEHKTLNGKVVDGTGRGDCTALCDIDINCYDGVNQATAISNIQAETLTKSTYGAYFAPYVTYQLTKDAEYDNNMTFPAVFHYLACAAKAAENFNEWYAIAGYTRGVSTYTINGIGCNFGEEAVQALEPRFKKNNLECAVNLIIKVKNNYYLWGNRTSYPLGTEGMDDGDLVASHFLNIRQLCSSIKKQVYVSCRRFTFDPNSDILWINFCNAIRPLLEKMKADQGIQDYKFIKVKTSQKAILKAIIRIVPIEAVEDFDISLTLEDSLSGIIAGLD